jgi:hypothetical protein
VIVVEDEWRKMDIPAHHIANASLAFDRQPLRLQRRDIAVDGAHRGLGCLGKILGTHERPRLQPGDDIQHAISAAHSFS